LNPELCIMTQLQHILANMSPSKAAQAIAAASMEIFPLLSEEERLAIIAGMIEGRTSDKVSSMVHL
jgi:hypothetical protein